MILSVAYRYKNLYRLSRGFHICICILYRVLGIIYSRSLPLYIEIYRVGDNRKLSICRRVRTFLNSWGQKTWVKHCFVDLSLCYEFWFAITCIDMKVILDLSTGTHVSDGAITHHAYESWQSERQTSSLIGRILDINVRSLYLRIYYQLNTTSISNRLQRYGD